MSNTLFQEEIEALLGYEDEIVKRNSEVINFFSLIDAVQGSIDDLKLIYDDSDSQTQNLKLIKELAELIKELSKKLSGYTNSDVEKKVANVLVLIFQLLLDNKELDTGKVEFEFSSQIEDEIKAIKFNY
jgi:hypothetical protein